MNAPQPSIIYHRQRLWRYVRTPLGLLKINTIYYCYKLQHRCSNSSCHAWRQKMQLHDKRMIGFVVWESLLAWLHGCVLCEPWGNKSSFSAPEAWSSFTLYLWAGSQGFERLWPLWPLLAPTGLQPSSCSSFQPCTLPSTPSSQRQKEEHPCGPKTWHPTPQAKATTPQA